MTVKDVAAYLTISVATVWRQAKLGTLPPPVRIGGATRWRRADIEAALNHAA
jgi:excisionase family DNA binding protein